MSVAQEDLLRRAKSGDRAAGEELIVGNSGLIWSIARRYFGLPWVSEGRRGI